MTVCESIFHILRQAEIVAATDSLQDWGRQFPEEHLNKARNGTVLKRFASLDVSRTISVNVQYSRPVNYLTQFHGWFRMACDPRSRVLRLTIDV